MINHYKEHYFTIQKEFLFLKSTSKNTYKEIATNSAVNKALRKAQERAGIPKEKRITSHGLRHSHASFLLMRGRGIKYISKRLEHHNASITLDVCSHVIDRMQQLEDSAVLNDLDTLNE